MPRLLVAWATDTKVMEPLLSCGVYNRTRVSLRTSGEFSLKKYREFPRRTPRKSSGKARWLDKEAFPELFRGVLLGNSRYFFRENSPEVLRLTLVLLYTPHERSGSMTFVSVAQATRSLGIDAKTLHRWLADAQLPLPCHPHDGRKKGLSEEHLQALARLHQRRLASSEEEGRAQLPCQIPALPADLLWLPEQLAAMQAQLVTLQQ